jgi:hypothetical protein
MRANARREKRAKKSGRLRGAVHCAPMNERPAPDLPRLKQLLLQMHLWLNEMLLWFAECLGAKLPQAMRAELLREFHETRRTVLMILVVHATALERGRPRPRYPVREFAGELARAPKGFRVQAHRGSDFRGFARGIKISGRTLRERYARLHAVIADFDRHVARFAKRLRGSKMKAPVMVRAPAVTLAALSAPAPIARDSS